MSAPVAAAAAVAPSMSIGNKWIGAALLKVLAGCLSIGVSAAVWLKVCMGASEHQRRWLVQSLLVWNWAARLAGMFSSLHRVQQKMLDASSSNRAHAAAVVRVHAAAAIEQHVQVWRLRTAVLKVSAFHRWHAETHLAAATRVCSSSRR